MNQKIQDVIDLFKSNELIKLSLVTDNWVWTQKAKDIAESQGYDICLNFCCTDNADAVWLLEEENVEYGFCWAYYNDENWNEALQKTLKIFGINNVSEIPVELEDIII